MNSEYSSLHNVILCHLALLVYYQLKISYNANFVIMHICYLLPDDDGLVHVDIIVGPSVSMSVYGGGIVNFWHQTSINTSITDQTHLNAFTLLAARLSFILIARKLFVFFSYFT